MVGRVRVRCVGVRVGACACEVCGVWLCDTMVGALLISTRRKWRTAVHAVSTKRGAARPRRGTGGRPGLKKRQVMKRRLRGPSKATRVSATCKPSAKTELGRRRASLSHRLLRSRSRTARLRNKRPWLLQPRGPPLRRLPTRLRQREESLWPLHRGFCLHSALPSQGTTHMWLALAGSVSRGSREQQQQQLLLLLSRESEQPQQPQQQPQSVSGAGSSSSSTLQ